MARMKFRTHLLSSFLLAWSLSLAAQTAPAPVITSIAPSSGPATGGTKVVILGTGLDIPPNFACLLPCPPLVRFGDVEVAAVENTRERVLVITPPHPHGIVDLTLRTTDGRSVTVPGGFSFVGNGEERFARALLPLLLNRTAGAHGSLWETELWIRNRGPANLELAPWPCESQACPAIFPLTKTLAPNESVRNIPPFFDPPSAVPGRILYVTRARIDEASFQLRLTDVSRSMLSWGTEIPVIREEDFRTGSVELLGVPIDANFRSSLRIYEMSPLASSTFRLSFFEQHTGVSVQPPVLTMQLNAVASETGEFRLEPGYAQILDLSALLTRTHDSLLRIQIEPLTPGSRYWAFVGVTNNSTQQVTTLTPQ